jgi:hypothetical protein
MTRLVPKEVSELMDAYSSIYGTINEGNEGCEDCTCDPCTCEEEVVSQESVDEDYIEEQGGSRGSGSSASQTNQSVSLAPIGRAAGNVVRSIGQSLSAAGRVPTSSGPRNVRGGGTRPAAPAARPPMPGLPASARQVTQYPAGVSTGVGGGNAGASRPAPARPAAPAARPAATARPAAPAARPAAPAATAAPKPATPAAAPAAAPAEKKPSLASGLADLRKMRAASQMRQAGANVVSTQLAGFDPFDVIKGHLLDEGYADSEDAALKIMANMSEDWKLSILEADSIAAMRERAAKRRKQRYGKDGGGGRDDFRPYTEDDYKNPKPGYGSGAASQAKDA